MRTPAAVVVASLVGLPVWGAFDSALAPYPWRQDTVSPSVEAVLGPLESQAAQTDGFVAEVTWSVEGNIALVAGRDDYGPTSLKSCPNWHGPPANGFWPGGGYTVAGRGESFVVQKAADRDSRADWWQKVGEEIYARAYTDDSGSVFRYHHDALEADMIGYGEGLGLLLWAFMPGEFIRRGEHLEAGEDREINGTTCTTLVATPDWIKRQEEMVLENRTNYPFNHSTMLSWAVHRPVVTYFVDQQRGLVIGAEFVYFDCFRSHPKEWRPVGKPSGLRVRCVATAFGETPGGGLYPTRMESTVSREDSILRRTHMTVSLTGVSPTIATFERPREKRVTDPWPLYRSGVYQAFLAAGAVNHANRVGCARALSYEGDIGNGLAAIDEALAGLEEDRDLSGETWGGVDWELGFALYEILWRCDGGEAAAIWDGLPRSEPWLIVGRQAVALYSRFRPAEKERIEVLMSKYDALFAQVRLPTYKERCLIGYITNLEKRSARAPTDAGREEIERVLARARARLAAQR